MDEKSSDSNGGIECRQSAVESHIPGADCWCEPEVYSVDPESGATVYVHREAQ